MMSVGMLHDLSREKESVCDSTSQIGSSNIVRQSAAEVSRLDNPREAEKGSLDKIPIRISHVYTANLPNGPGSFYNLGAFQNL